MQKLQLRRAFVRTAQWAVLSAEVRDGVWVGQEPGWDSPFNLGAHCAKGSTVRELGHGERRLKSNEVG